MSYLLFLIRTGLNKRNCFLRFFFPLLLAMYTRAESISRSSILILPPMTGILIQGWCQYGNKYLLLLLSTVQGCWDAGGNLRRRGPDSVVVRLITAQVRKAAGKLQAAVIRTGGCRRYAKIGLRLETLVTRNNCH